MFAVRGATCFVKRGENRLVSGLQPQSRSSARRPARATSTAPVTRSMRSYGPVKLFRVEVALDQEALADEMDSGHLPVLSRPKELPDL
jgi:hypothetical protein